MTRYRYRFVADPQYIPDGCDGNPLPESEECYRDNPYTPGGGRALTYAEYLRYYGDPDLHVGAGVIVECMTPADQDWREIASVWGIDWMYDDPAVQDIGRTVYAYADVPAAWRDCLDGNPETETGTEGGRS